MTRRMLLALLLAALLSTEATAQVDQVDLSTAVWHGVNASTFPITGGIERVTVTRSGPYRTDGIRVTAPTVNAWPDVWALGLGDGGGAMLYTTVICLPVQGLHCAGFVQHWRGENGSGTGGAWLQTAGDGRLNWNANWAYDANRWGPMAAYVPKPGDTVYIFLAAGNVRTGQDPEFAVVNGRPFRARTNVVAFAYPANDDGTFAFDTTATPPTPPMVVPPVVTPPAAGPDYGPRVTTLEQDVAAIQAALEPLSSLQGQIDSLLGMLAALQPRIEVLERKPMPVRCIAAANIGIRIPISCRLE